MYRVNVLSKGEKFMDSNGCNTSPGWMIVNCPVSCHACHLRDPAVGPLLILLTFLSLVILIPLLSLH